MSKHYTEEKVEQLERRIQKWEDGDTYASIGRELDIHEAKVRKVALALNDPMQQRKRVAMMPWK